MYNTPWSDEELADLDLPWEEFRRQPHQQALALDRRRSHAAWRIKRGEVREGRTPPPRVKVAPVKGTLPDEALAASMSDREVFLAVLDFQAKMRTRFPLRREHAVSVDVDEPIAVCFPSDWHLGDEGTDLARLLADCELIASHPRLYVALGGDVCNNAIFAKMADAVRAQVRPSYQWVMFRYLIKLLHDSGSLLWVSSGNHDAWTFKAADLDPVLESVRGLPVVYTGEGGYITVTVGAQEYVIWRKHKPTRFNSNFNRTHYLKQMLRGFLPREFDIGIAEHLHQPEVNLWTYRERVRALLCCGTYKVDDAWAESGGFYDGGYGVPTVVLWPDRRRVQAYESIGQALETLDGPSWRPRASSSASAPLSAPSSAPATPGVARPPAPTVRRLRRGGRAPAPPVSPAAALEA